MPAVMKLRDEMAQNPKHSYIQLIGNFLIENLQSNPAAAEKILAKDKTIKGSLNAMKDVARKSQVDGCSMMTDTEGLEIVLKYFGIDGKATAAVQKTEPVRPVQTMRGIEFDVSLDDLLGPVPKR